MHDYYENRLSEKSRKLFERHMAVCPMCRTSLAEYVKTIELGQALFDQSSRELIFVDSPRELIDAIIDVNRSQAEDDDG